MGPSKKSAIVSRSKRTALQLFEGVVLLLMVGCSPSRTERPPVPPGDNNSTAKRVDAIDVEAKRIDSAIEAPETAELRRLRKDLNHWELYGTFQGQKPVYLSARFSEGQVIREERYYMLNEKLALVRIEKWWDVDDPSRAPEPKASQEFYVDNDREIRHVMEVAASPPVSKTNDAVRPAAAWVERSHLIARILLGDGKDANAAQALDAFPEAETSRQ
jgi:hypothetical protein